MPSSPAVSSPQAHHMFVLIWTTRSACWDLQHRKLEVKTSGLMPRSTAHLHVTPAGQRWQRQRHNASNKITVSPNHWHCTAMAHSCKGSLAMQAAEMGAQHSHSGNLCPSGPQGYWCPHKLQSHTATVVIFVLQVLKVTDVHTNCAVTHSHSGNLHPSGPQGYWCPHKLQSHTATMVIFILQVLKVTDVQTNCAVTHSHSGNLCPSGPQGYRCPHKLCSHTQPQW